VIALVVQAVMNIEEAAQSRNKFFIIKYFILKVNN